MKKGIVISLVVVFFALVVAGAVTRLFLACSDHHDPTKVQLSAEGQQEGEILMMAYHQWQTPRQAESGVSSAMAVVAR